MWTAQRRPDRANKARLRSYRQLARLDRYDRGRREDIETQEMLFAT